MPCRSCQSPIPSHARYCPSCGAAAHQPSSQHEASETLHLRSLYIMVVLLVLAVLFPPWEAAPGEPPQFLGLSFLLSPPREDAIVSRMLQTIQLVTIAVGGMYSAWLLRGK